MSNKTLLHSETIIVRWGDMDAFGHVNNSVYFRYFEQCRVNWLEETEHGSSRNGGKEGPVLINASANFLRPLHYPATVMIKMYGSEVGRSSFLSEYEIYDNKDTSILYTTGSAKIVWVDQTKGKSTPLPDSICSMIK